MNELFEKFLQSNIGRNIDQGLIEEFNDLVKQGLTFVTLDITIPNNGYYRHLRDIVSLSGFSNWMLGEVDIAAATWVVDGVVTTVPHRDGIPGLKKIDTGDVVSFKLPRPIDGSLGLAFSLFKGTLNSGFAKIYDYQQPSEITLTFSGWCKS